MTHLGIIVADSLVGFLIFKDGAQFLSKTFPVYAVLDQFGYRTPAQYKVYQGNVFEPLPQSMPTKQSGNSSGSRRPAECPTGSFQRGCAGCNNSGT
jgi:hypothetical protein